MLYCCVVQTEQQSSNMRPSGATQNLFNVAYVRSKLFRQRLITQVLFDVLHQSFALSSCTSDSDNVKVNQL